MDFLVLDKSEHRVFFTGCWAVVLLKVVLLVLDPHPAFFLGDSMAFLGTAMTGWFPPQRSWAYGMVVGLLAFPGKGFFSLVVLQTMAGIMTSWVAGWCLVRYLNVKASVAVVVMIILALDPLHLMYERMVMSETLSLTGVAFFLWFSLTYLEKPRWMLLVLVELAFFWAMLMRLQMLYPLLPVAVALPFLAYWKHSGGFTLRAALCHWLLALVLIATTHSAHRYAMAIKNEQPPAYSYGTNLILLGSFAPALEFEDVSDPLVQQALVLGVSIPLDDRSQRNAHAWEEGGLALTLIEHTGDFYDADRLAGEMLRSTVLRDPFAIAITGLLNYADHFNVAEMSHWLSVDRGDIDYPPDVQELLDSKFGFSPGEYFDKTLVRSWHSVGHPYYLLLALSPLVFLIAWLMSPKEQKISVGMICLIGVLLNLQNLCLSCLPSMRLLHPVSLPLWIAGAIIFTYMMNKRARL